MDRQLDSLSTEPSPSEHPAILVPPGFWIRAKAMVFDGLILGVVAGVIDQLANAFHAWPASSWFFGIIGSVVEPVYYLWAYSRSGQTPGKKLVGIKVVSIDGSPLNWRRGLLRTMGYFVSALPLNLGFLWSIWDEDKQTWHDKLAGTRVVLDWVPETQVRQAFDRIALRKRSGAWKWVAAGFITLELAVVVCCVIAAIVIPSSRPTPQVHDDEWDRFESVLFARVNPDPAIPSFHTSRGYYWPSSKETEVWLEMELTYDNKCEAGSTNDWCYQLANELVKIVFDNYPHIDEINGIHIVMSKISSTGLIEVEQTPVDEALTIDAWRQRLSAEEP